MTNRITTFCKACVGGSGLFHRDCTGVTQVRGRDGVVTAEGPCPCAAGGHAVLKYSTHGDPYSDPPRASVCRRCGALVGDVEAHDAWHGVIDSFGCLEDRDHVWEGSTVSNSVGESTKQWCRRCQAVYERVLAGGVVVREGLVR